MAGIGWDRVIGYACVAVAALLVAGFSARLAGAPVLVIYERGVSMPQGIYLYHHRPPARVGEVIVLENAPNWSRPYLMKRVVAVAGERFCWDRVRQQHQAGERWLPGPSARARELHIPIWRGCRRLWPGEVVAWGDYADSYDSRYLGPVREAEISGIYRRVLPLSSPPARPAPAE